MVASELLEEVQWQGTDKDMTALLVLTLHIELDPVPTPAVPKAAHRQPHNCWDQPA